MFNKKTVKIKSTLLSLCLMLFSINTFAVTIRSGEKLGSALTVANLEDCSGGSNQLFSHEFESFEFDKADSARPPCKLKQELKLAGSGILAVTKIIGGAGAVAGACAIFAPSCGVAVAVYIGGIYWAQFKFVAAAMECVDSNESQEDRIRREVCEQLALKGIDCSQDLGRASQ